MQLKPPSSAVENKLRQVQSTIKMLGQSGNERWKNIKTLTKQQQHQHQQVRVNSTESDAATPVWTQRMETLFGPLNDQLRLIKCDNCGILTRETNSRVGVTHKLNCEMLRKSALMSGSLMSKKFGAQFSNHLEPNSKKRASSEVSLDSMNMPTKKKKKTTIIDYTQSSVTTTATGPNSSQQSPESSGNNSHLHIFNGIPMTQKQIKKALAAAERLEREAERKEKKRLEEEARKAKKLSRAKGGPVNVNEQCGVLVPPNNTPCARSLTCKTHSMGAKRSVPGRSAPYDVLLNEWQKKHNPNWGDRKVVTPRVGPGIEPGQSKKKKKEASSNTVGGGNNRTSNKSNHKNDQEGSNNNQHQSHQEDYNAKDNNDNKNHPDKSINSNPHSKVNGSTAKPFTGSNGPNSHHQSGLSNKKSSNANGSKGDNRTTSEKMSAINQAKLLGEVDEDFYLLIPPIKSLKNDSTKHQKRSNTTNNSGDDPKKTVDQDGDTVMDDSSKKMTSGLENADTIKDNDDKDDDDDNQSLETSMDESDLELELVIKGLIVSQNLRKPLDQQPTFESNSCSYLSHTNHSWSKFSKLGVKESFKKSLKVK